MNTITILSVLIALTWAKNIVSETSKSETFYEIAIKAFLQCGDIEGIDQNMLLEFKIRDILPENNEIYNNWMECYWSGLGQIDENGDFVDGKLRKQFALYIKDEFDVTTDVNELANAAVDHCKDTPKGISVGQTVIKFKNCLMGYIISQDIKRKKPATFEERATVAFAKCKDVKGFNLKIHLQFATSTFVPEDDEVSNNWIECYWKEMGFITNNGDFNEGKMKEELPNFIEQQYQVTVSQKFADDIIDQCRNTTKGISVGQSIVKRRNCIMKLVLPKVTTIEPRSYEDLAKEAFSKCVHIEGVTVEMFHIFGTVDILPIDNEIYNNYMECFWKALGLVDDDGNFVDAVMQEQFPLFVKEKYSISSPYELANDALMHCKETPKGESHGQTIMIQKNCLMEDVISKINKSKPKSYGDFARQAYSKCTDVEGFTREVYIDMLLNDILPLDNEIYNRWMLCYWKALGYVDDNGEFINTTIQEQLVLFMEGHFRVTANANELASDAVTYCDHTSKDDPIEQKVMKRKNCLMEYLIEKIKKSG